MIRARGMPRGPGDRADRTGLRPGRRAAGSQARDRAGDDLPDLGAIVQRWRPGETGPLHRRTAGHWPATAAGELAEDSPRQAESLSSWDPSGQRIAFIRFEGVRTRVFEVNADGSCQFALTKRPRHKTRRIGPLQFGLAWQPGPGRGAGPIAC